MISEIDYASRFARLETLLGNGALVLPAQPRSVRNSDVSFPYRQDSFFHYLSGFAEGNSLIVVARDSEGHFKRSMFLEDRDPEREMWDGRRLGVERAATSLAVHAAFSIEELWEKLPKLLTNSDCVYFPLGIDSELDRRFIEALGQATRLKRKDRTYRVPIADPIKLAGELRSLKAPEEVERLKKAAAATAAAYREVLNMPLVGLSERDVHAALIAGFLKNGAEMEAYSSIVAGGENACILHYVENRMTLKDGDLLLIDAGAQFEYYACDVTRTFPVGARFSPAQRTVYELVLDAQKACIAASKPGSDLELIHQTAVRKLSEGLIDLGILKASINEVLDKTLFKPFYPHGTSHWLGMDVHDVGEYREGNGKAIRLQEGMYFTIEPGLYFPKDNQAVPPEFRGIGVRIEDDILIDGQGAAVLTSAIPKEIKDLENR